MYVLFWPVLLRLERRMNNLIKMVAPCHFTTELIQTELHHVRTLRIMEGVFRRGMLEEVLLEPGIVHAVFPCLDQLVMLHSRFVSQLLSRRNHSLAPGSATNFTIQQLGDVLVEQVGTEAVLIPRSLHWTE